MTNFTFYRTVISVVLSSALYAQSPVQFIIQPTDSFSENILRSHISYRKEYASHGAAEKELRNILLTLQEKGFLAASFDSIARDTLHFTVFLSTGSRYNWARLNPGNTDEELLESTGYKERIYAGKTINPSQVRRLFEKILIRCENNGYPFATVRLDSITTEGNTIEASLNVTKNELCKIDSVIVAGSAKIAPVYLYNYTGIKPGNIYNELYIRRLPNRIREIPFVKETRPFQVVFTEKFTKLYLFFDHRSASYFNGVMGVLPDAYDSESIILTGDVKLKLNNSLGKGEVIDLNWRKMQTNTQDLNANFVYPFLFNTPFGGDLNLKLYKRDTSFLDIQENAGIQYLLTGGNYFRAFIVNQESALLSTKGLEKITTLPAYADVRVFSYGIGFKAEQLDYRLNPRKGYTIDFSGSAGTKTIKKNPNINPVIYDSLHLQSVQYKANINSGVFLPLTRRSTFYSAVQGGYLLNPNLFGNEFFRIGGLKTLRGFDEESINASLFGILTFEYRFVLEQNSWFFVFWNGAYYENRVVAVSAQPGSRFDTPFGFGTGVTFDTKAGIFSVSYALGKQFGNPLLIRSGKVHFGFVGFF